MCFCSDGPISGWLFEESLTFLEVTGAFAFWMVRNSIHEGILYMWSRLRTVALFFLQYRPGQHIEACISAAQQAAYEFAVYAEKHLQGKFMTMLVHRLVNHIPNQVRRGLPGAFVREDWGERCVRKCKTHITGHATKMVARAAASICLTQMSMRITKSMFPDVDAPLTSTAPQPRARAKDTCDQYGVMLSELKPASLNEDGDEVSPRSY